MPDWPRKGCCGACGRDAREYPSGRWEHVGRPCRARSQDMWHIDDLFIKRACRFVPEGELLPVEPSEPHWHTTDVDETGFPIGLGWCTADHMHSVREALALEAERPMVDVHLPESPSGDVDPLAVP